MKRILLLLWFVNAEFWPNCPLGWDCQVVGEISVPCYSGGESFFWGAWQVWAWPCRTLWSSREYLLRLILNMFRCDTKTKKSVHSPQLPGPSPIDSWNMDLVLLTGYLSIFFHFLRFHHACAGWKNRYHHCWDGKCFGHWWWLLYRKCQSCWSSGRCNTRLMEHQFFYVDILSF